MEDHFVSLVKFCLLESFFDEARQAEQLNRIILRTKRSGEQEDDEVHGYLFGGLRASMARCEVMIVHFVLRRRPDLTERNKLRAMMSAWRRSAWSAA